MFDRIPFDFHRTNLNQIIDFAMPGSSRLQVSVMEGMTMLTPFSPYGAFTRAGDPEYNRSTRLYAPLGQPSSTASTFPYQYRVGHPNFPLTHDGHDLIVFDLDCSTTADILSCTSIGEPILVTASIQAFLNQQVRVKVRCYYLHMD